MQFVILLVCILGAVMIGGSEARPEEGEEDVLARVKRGCCLCICGSGKKKRSAEGQAIDHGMTKRFAPELELLGHYRKKRAATGWCCCICVSKAKVSAPALAFGKVSAAAVAW